MKICAAMTAVAAMTGIALGAMVIQAAPAAPGRQNPRQQRVPRYDAAAVVKLVPVRVLNAAGQPLRGLRKDDFILLDNGESKTITEFEVHESGPREAAGEMKGPAAAKAFPEANRKYFFLLDLHAGDIYGNRDAKKAVLEFVESELRPGDEASVMTFGAMTGLVLKQYLTSDLEKIRKAVSRSKEMGAGAGVSGGGGGDIAIASGGGAERADDEEEDIAARRESAQGGEEGANSEVQIAGAKPGMIKRRVPDDSPFGLKSGIQIDVPGLGSMARTKADFDASMADLAKSLSYVPGSKSVVFFSTRTPGKDAARLFAEANSTIYAVNTNSVPETGGGAGAGRRREAKKRQGVALTDFAQASGGHYFADVKDARTIARDVEMLSGNYYVLGYYITPAWEGREHKIDVRIARPDVRVLVQEKYNDPKPFAQMTDLEKELHLFDLTLSDQPAMTDVLDLPASVLQSAALTEANAAILLEVAVDEKSGVPPGKTEIFSFVFDKDHKIIVAERGELDTTFHAQKPLFPYLLTRLPPGDYECRVAVRHMETGQSAARRMPFRVSPPAEAMSLFSPLLLVPGEKAEFVRMARPLPKKKELASIIRFYPFLPEKCRPLLSGLTAETRTIWALLPYKPGDGETSEMRLDLRLFRSGEDEKKAKEGVKGEGEEIPVDWRLLDTRRADDSTEFLLVGIRIPDLAPGAYRIEFTATDAASGAIASASAPFTRK